VFTFFSLISDLCHFQDDIGAQVWLSLVMFSFSPLSFAILSVSSPPHTHQPFRSRFLFKRLISRFLTSLKITHALSQVPVFGLMTRPLSLTPSGETHEQCKFYGFFHSHLCLTSPIASQSAKVQAMADARKRKTSFLF